mmetsp:Transcript_8921/g.21773  ORF Transcript_8921/g.21773 Transcript_8921/m.21773 type:complete len:681 (-) Transcript_8921:586-2628(-)|eukprot:CAMPEP_0178998014 /NCGR_PEP_ID=MMETSP0795-20121207/9296_1 /TAXON_ID=88552 /ORGANISM="Amoebophrya sp., Strain Ameob2" /LENGTH=680 /DNA_ID=CAMNT_0020690683 /DNA_START=100 /DNA_END=2142 /DNA_ORIENTATION=+
MEIDQEGPVGSPGTGRAPGATTDVEMEGAPETVTGSLAPETDSQERQGSQRKVMWSASTEQKYEEKQQQQGGSSSSSTTASTTAPKPQCSPGGAAEAGAAGSSQKEFEKAEDAARRKQKLEQQDTAATVPGNFHLTTKKKVESQSQKVTQKIEVPWAAMPNGGEVQHLKNAVAMLLLDGGFTRTNCYPEEQEERTCVTNQQEVRVPYVYIMERETDKSIYLQQPDDFHPEFKDIDDAESRKECTHKNKIVLGRKQEFQSNSEPNGLHCNYKYKMDGMELPSTVSSCHCEITREEGLWYLTDRSSNGTFLEHTRIVKGAPKQLPPHARVHFGQHVRLDPSTESGAVVDGTGVIFRFKAITHKSGVWERYDKLKPIGKGNFAEVFLGVEKKRTTGQQFAIKCIDSSKFEKFTKNRQTTLQLEDEEKLLRELHHTNIVQFFEMIKEGENMFLITEYCAGGDLLQRLLDYGVYNDHHTKRVFTEILSALEYLHDLDIVHRDLKPENVLLSCREEHATAKVADFGLARYLDTSRYMARIVQTSQGEEVKTRPALQRKLTAAKTFCGTPHYFAPEIIMTQQNNDKKKVGYDTKVDVWSAGVILYILLSATPPFDDEGLYEQIVDGQYGFEDEEWHMVVEEAKDLVTNMMRVDPEKRFTVSEAMAHPWLGNGPGPAPKRRRESAQGG